MANTFDIKKLLSGFNIFNGATLGKLLWNVIVTIIVIALVAGIWYKMFGQRTENTTQTADQITNVEPADKDGFNLIKIKILGFGN